MPENIVHKVLREHLVDGTLEAGQPITYRWRPGATPDTCYMDVLRLVPAPDGDPMPAPAPCTRLSLDQPWKTIPAKVRKAILNGSGDEEVEFSYQRGDHRHGYARAFEGVLAWLDRRYKETESEGIREVLEAYMNMRPCPACGGTRLKK